MSWRPRLDPELNYIVDLVQLPDGQRYLWPRPAGAERVAHATLSSKPYRGSELTAWQIYGKVPECVELQDGNHFVVDAHGVWMTQEEAEYWTLNCSQAGLEDPNAPWINHLAPKFAPK